MKEQNQFDVFLVHNSLDKPQIRVIANKLKEQGLRPWLDEEQIVPGQLFQDAIQKAISQIKSAVVFIGSNDLGKWQAIELQTLISQFIDRGIPVIPVLLPEVDKIPEDLSFLKQFNWVSFEDIDDDSALYNLESGIIGRSRTEYLEYLETKQKQLTDLILQKSVLEDEIKEIEKTLNAIGSQVNQDLRALLDWLSQREKLAKKYGYEALKKFPSLEQEVKRKNNLDRFYQEINCYLDFLCVSMETGNMIFLAEPGLNPSLANPEMYKFSCFEVYTHTFEIIQNRIPDYIKVSIKNKLREHIDYMLTRFDVIKIETETEDFDILLCYQGLDQLEVGKISEQLQEYQINFYKYQWESNAENELAVVDGKLVGKINSLGIFIGNNEAPWEDEGIQNLIWRFIDDRLTVILIILPNTQKDLKLPSYLKRRQIVDFRQKNINPILQLVHLISKENEMGANVNG